MEPGTLSNRLLQGLIDQLQDAVFIIQDSHFIFVNTQLCELFQHSEDELLSQNIFDFVHSEDKDFVQDMYTRRLAGDNPDKEYIFRIITGQKLTKDVHIKVNTLLDEGGKKVSIGSLRDVTRETKIQKDLEASQTDILNILNNLPDVFYRTDADGLVTYMSPSVEECLGYLPEEMRGRPLADFYLDPGEREKIVQALVEGNGKAKQVEAWLKHKNGDPIWISTNAYVRNDEHGTFIGVEGIARNITA